MESYAVFYCSQRIICVYKESLEDEVKSVSLKP